MARMVTSQSGGDSLLLLARQSAYGTPVTDFANFINRNFPFARNTLNISGTFIQNDGVYGRGFSPPQILDTINPGGQIDPLWRPEDVIHSIIWMMNAAIPVADTNDNALDNQTVELAESANANYPSKVVATFSAAATAGTFTIEGVVASGRTAGDSETETVSYARGATTASSSKFYRSAKVTGAPSGATYAFQPDTRKVDLQLGSLSSGLVAYTIQMQKGEELVVAQNVVVASGTITMGNEVGISIDTRAGTYYEGVLATNVQARATTIPNLDTRFLTDTSNLTVGRPLGTALTFGTVGGDMSTVADPTDETNEKVVTTDNVVLTINNNLQDPTGNTGNPFSGQPGIGDQGRQITLQVEKTYEKGTDAQDWTRIFRNSSALPARLDHFSVGSDGRLYRIRFDLTGCTLSEAAQTPIEGRATIPETINLDVAGLTCSIWSRTGYSTGNGISR